MKNHRINITFDCFYEIIITDETEKQIAVVSTTGEHI
mgnify:CR=1 FL=1